MKKLILKKVVISFLIIVLIMTGAVFLYPKFNTKKPINVILSGERFISVNLPIRIEFPYKWAKIGDIEKYFYISPVVRSSRLSFDGKILTLEHEKNLQYDTEYTIKILKGVKTSLFKTLEKDYVVTFKTAPTIEEKVTLYESNLDKRPYLIYNLNYYDHDYKIFLEPYASGKFIFETYKTTYEKIFEAISNRYEGEKLETAYKEGEPLDIQYLYLYPEREKNIYVPKLQKVGCYYVKARYVDKEEYFSFFIVLSKHRATIKRLGDKFIVWVVDLKTSSGLANVQVKALGHSADKKLLFEDFTNSKGIVEKVISPKEDSNNKPEFILTKDGENFSILNIDPYIYLRGDWYAFSDKNKAHVYIDRPIYKPGDTVNFKAILREKVETFYVPLRKEITVKIQEETYGTASNTIYEKKIIPNENGTLADSFKLSKELKTGYYIVQLKLENEVLGGAKFNIEFYQKPDFEISISTDKEDYIKKEEIVTEIKAKYFFGSPLKNEKFEWHLYYYNNKISFGEGIFDQAGSCNIRISTENVPIPDWYGEYGYPIPITLEVLVKEKSGKVSSKTKIVNVYPGQFSFSLVSPENLNGIKSGKPYSFIVEASNVLIRHAIPNLSLNITLGKMEMSEYHYYNPQVIKELKTVADASGKAKFELNFPSSGYYFLAIEAQDSFQNRIRKEFHLWVSIDEKISKNSENYTNNIVIFPEKEPYLIGEKAKITLSLPRQEGSIFISIYTTAFKKISIENITGYFKTLEIPISEDLVPGFYVYATLLNDDKFVEQWYYIETIGKRLTIDITSSKQILKPGEEIELLLKTLDGNGYPVSAEVSFSVVDKAVFSLKSDLTGNIYETFYSKLQDRMVSVNTSKIIYIAVGEKGGEGGCFLKGTKILMQNGSLKNIEEIKVGDYILTKESKFSSRLAPDRVIKTFKHIVNEYLIINDVLKITPNHPVFINGDFKNISEAEIGDWLLNEKGKKVFISSVKRVNEQVEVYNLETEKYHTFFADSFYVHNKEGEGGVRSNFVDSAYWNPLIVTDTNGEAKIKFKLPDNLTTWVAMSKGVTQDTQVGEGVLEFKTFKDLIIRPVIPQFFRNDDKIFISAFIHNNLGNSTKFKTQLKIEGAKILNDAIKNIEIFKGEIINVSWQIEIGKGNTTKLTFLVEDLEGTAKDGMEVIIPLYSTLSKSRKILSGVGASKFDFSFDDEAHLTRREAIISIKPSVLAVLPEVIEKLTGYPYGCVEQTMSRHLPNILAYKEKGTLEIELKQDFKEILNEGFDRLNKFQHSDGGFGWWENDANNPWMSGYVFEGLYEAKTAGLLNGREIIYARLLEYLKKSKDSFTEEENIYIHYVLSKAGEKDITEKPVEEFANKLLSGKVFDIQSEGYIALSLYHNGNLSKAKGVLKNILAKIKENHWEMGEEINWGSMKDKYSATGVNLLALIKIDFQEEIATRIIQWLMRNRLGYEGLWGSTRQSAQILFALIEYLKKTNELKPDFTYEIYLNQELVKKDRVNNGRYAFSLTIPLEKIKRNNTLEIKQTGKGNIYWTFLMNSYLPGYKIGQGNPNIKIEKEYLDLQGKKVSQFTPGMLLKARLKIVTKDRLDYVVLTDFLPSGFEVQNIRLENVNGKIKAGEIYFMGWYDAFDFRDEMVSLFFRGLRQGEYTIEYLVRVVYCGDFEVPSPYLECMYEPENFAYGNSIKITVK